mgnify:CR=1 FL=1
MKSFKIIVAVFVIFNLLSCKKWLDVRPKSEIDERVLFSTQDGFDQALTGVYIKMAAPQLYGDNLTLSFIDVLSQNYQVTSTSNIYYPASQYDYTNQSVRSTLDIVWGQMYNAIWHLNNILANLDGNKAIFNNGRFNLYKGEVLALRAYMHFDLLRLFGPVYSIDSAKLAIPYLKLPLARISSRISASSVMNSIISDLREADALMGSDPILSSSALTTIRERQNKMNALAVKGTLARVLMYRGSTEDKASALLLSQSVINSNVLRFVSNNDIINGRDKTFNTEHLFSMKSQQLPDQVNIHFIPGAPQLLTNDINVIRQTFEVSSSGSVDYRYTYLWENTGTVFLNRKYTNELYVPLLRLSEMYYIAAECESSNPSVATNYLNVIRANRAVTPLSSLNTTQVLSEIFKEYKKEFIGEGQLLYYYKRLNRPSIDGTSKNTTEVYNIPLPANEIEFGN